MADWTLKSWKDIPNTSAGWGIPDEMMEMRIGRSALGLTDHGVSYAKFGKDFVPTFGHRQKQQEETYCLISGSCTAKLGDELVQRLCLLAPPIVAGLQGGELAPLVRRRRNAAAHCFEAPASFIAVAGSTALNRLQCRRAVARTHGAEALDSD